MQFTGISGIKEYLKCTAFVGTDRKNEIYKSRIPCVIGNCHIHIKWQGDSVGIFDRTLGQPQRDFNIVGDQLHNALFGRDGSRCDRFVYITPQSRLMHQWQMSEIEKILNLTISTGRHFPRLVIDQLAIIQTLDDRQTCFFSVVETGPDQSIFLFHRK